MCPKLTELLSWNGTTVHVCCFMLARASTKALVSRIHIRQPSPKKTAKKSSLPEKFVNRVTRQPRYHCIGLHVKCPLFLSDFNENWILLIYFRKMVDYHISWKSAQWEPSFSMRTDGQTDRHDEASNHFRNLAKASNNGVGKKNFSFAAIGSAFC